MTKGKKKKTPTGSASDQVSVSLGVHLINCKGDEIPITKPSMTKPLQSRIAFDA